MLSFPGITFSLHKVAILLLPQRANNPSSWLIGVWISEILLYMKMVQIIFLAMRWKLNVFKQ